MEAVGDDSVVLLGDVARREAALIGDDGDRRAVHVGAGDHQDVVAAHPVVAGEDVRGDVGAGGVAEVAGAAGVGPGDPDEDLFGRAGWDGRLRSVHW
jgi:hypothetical protein